jgi:hypothetical protein
LNHVKAKPAKSATTELAALLLLRNLALLVIVLAGTVAIVALLRRPQPAQITAKPHVIAAAHDVPADPEFTEAQLAPGETVPPMLDTALVATGSPPDPAAGYDPTAVWSYSQINALNPRDTPQLGVPVKFTYYCGHADEFVPGNSHDIFARIDPQSAVERYALEPCPSCASALKYVNWKEAQGGR